MTLVDVVDDPVDAVPQAGTAPLTLAGGRAFLGTRALDPGAGPAVGLSADDAYLWTVRRDGEDLYLQGHLRREPWSEGAARCFFRRPRSRPNARLVAAAPLDDGALAVATTQGLMLYSRRSRSWYDVWLGAITAGPRDLYRLGDHLVVRYDDQLVFVPSGALGERHSCATGPVAVAHEELVIEPATAVAIDGANATFDPPSIPPYDKGGRPHPSQGTVAWIEPDQRLRQWQDGTVTTLLAAPAEAPAPGSLRRLYGAGDQLLLTTDEAIYGYSLVDQRWTRSDLYFAGRRLGPAALNLEPDGEAWMITARSDAGEVLIGNWTPGERNLQLNRILRAESESGGRFGAAAEDLLDVQESQEGWTFVLTDRIKTYAPAERCWTSEIRFPGPPDPTVEYRRAGGRRVVVKDGGAVWWVERELSGNGNEMSWETLAQRFAAFAPPPGGAHAVDAGGVVWSLQPDGAVLRCAPAENEYACREHVPPALVLDPSAVVGAWVRLDVVVFVTAGGLRVYDRARRREAPLPGAAGVTGVRGVWPADDGLWLRVAFTSDRLLAAAAHGGRLHVMTAAFHEVATDASELAAGAARRLLPRVDTTRLVSFPRRPGIAGHLYRSHPGGVDRWNPDRASFQPVSGTENPFLRRTLAATDRLRLSAQGGRIHKQIRLDQVAGNGSQWHDYALSTRGFPFDQVTAIGAFDGRLFVSTRAGLQVFGHNGGTGLDDAEACYDLGRAAASEPRLGQPVEARGRFFFAAGSTCHEWRRGRFSDCADRPRPDVLWRGENDLWGWLQTRDGAWGLYKSGGAPTREAASFDGRFPHDQLRDLTACRGRAATLWRNGWISIYGGLVLQLGDAEHSDVLAAERPRGLTCVPQATTFPWGQLPPGLYVDGGGRRFWRRVDGGFQPVDEAAGEELRRLVDTPPILRFDRLRLRQPRSGGRFTFEQLARDGRWRELPWRDGRVVIDHLRDLEMIGDRGWAATPAGLVAVERDADGVLRFDPDQLHVIREPVAGDGPCDVTDMDRSGDRLRVRCDGDGEKVFAGVADGRRDRGVFRRLPAPDPFAERELVRTDYWRWRRTGRVGGRPGTLEVELRDEALGLAAGRFDFDGLTAIALFAPEQVELATAHGGWYRASVSGPLPVRDLVRPDAVGQPRAIRGLGVTRRGDQRWLCLEQGPGRYLLLSESGDTAEAGECPEDLGAGLLWQYAQIDGRLRITAPGRSGGVAQREMTAGRFHDDVVRGLPATGSDEGRVYYLVPTQAGILRLSTGVEEIYAPSFQGLEPGTAPAIVLVDPAGRPLYLSPQGLHALEPPDRPPLVLSGLPDAAEVIAMERGPQDFFRLRWVFGDESGWNLLRLGEPELLAANRFVMDASQYSVFVRGRVNQGAPSPLLGVELLPSAVRFSSPPGDRPSFDLPWPRRLAPLAVAVAGDRLLIVEGEEITEVALQVAVGELR